MLRTVAAEASAEPECIIVWGEASYPRKATCSKALSALLDC